MNNIPKVLRAEMAADPFYGRCARQDALHDHECQRDPLRPGQAVEWEHTLSYANRQVQRRFAIIPICWWAHRGPGLNKEINIWITLNRGSDEEILEFSRKGGRDYFLYRGYLNKKYGVYNLVENPVETLGIGCGYHGDTAQLFPN